MSDYKDNFRDHISTVDAGGRKRKWMYPKEVNGKLFRMRTWLSRFFLLALFTMPFIKTHGHQLLLFNILERKFIVFGLVISPHDFHLFVFAMLTFIVFVVLFTVIFGRIFCGWICPQTIFMEMVFRKIEYWIEGDFKARKRLDEAPLNGQKILKKTSKHFLFIIISFAIANTFLAYIIGSDTLLKIIIEPIEKHIVGFITIWAFTTAFYLVFSRIRELVCIIACPYGRLQGVLLDQQSIVVAYNYKRGEPRGKIQKEAPISHGDCVDCNLCVDVCPTGIDIRNGTQLECVNCTTCIDICNEVMHKTKRQPNLIGFYSDEQIKTNRTQIWNKRTIAYTILLGLLLSITAYLLLTRKPIEATILRTPGMLFQRQAHNKISNLYNYEIINKTYKPINITLKTNLPESEIQLIGSKQITIPAETVVKGSFFIIIPQEKIKSYKTKMKLYLISDQLRVDEVKTNFLGN